MIKFDAVYTVKLHYEQERDENTLPFDKIKETVKELPKALKELIEDEIDGDMVVTVEEVESLLTED